MATEYSLKFDESMTEDEIEERSFRSLLPSEAHRRGTMEKKSRHHEESEDDGASHTMTSVSGAHSILKVRGRSRRANFCQCISFLVDVPRCTCGFCLSFVDSHIITFHYLTLLLLFSLAPPLISFPHNLNLFTFALLQSQDANMAFSGGQDSFSQFTMDMVRQYMKDEEVRLQHQSSLLHLRQKALKEKTRTELAWLEHQKKKLRDKGEDDKMPPIRKKQRGLLMKLQQEQVHAEGNILTLSGNKALRYTVILTNFLSRCTHVPRLRSNDFRRPTKQPGRKGSCC